MTLNQNGRISPQPEHPLAAMPRGCFPRGCSIRFSNPDGPQLKENGFIVRLFFELPPRIVENGITNQMAELFYERIG